MAVGLTYTGTPFPEQIRQSGFKPGGLFSVAPRQIFSTTNPVFASTYGTPIKLATPKSAFSLPSFNFSSGVAGKEIIQSPKAATKGMRLAEMAERLKNVSPTAKNLLAGKTVTGLGGAAPPGILRSIFSLPMSAVTIGPQLIAAGMTPRTQAGFDFMKGFDEGAITSIADAENALGFEDFSKGIMAADAAATQKAALENALIDPEVTAAIDAQTADELAQLPIDPIDKRGIFSKIIDRATPIAKDIAGRSIASKALGGVGNILFGIPGAIAGTIFGGLKGGGLFNDPFIGGVTTIDEFGNVFSGADLDKLNALGGYYTDAARASRRRDRSIEKIRARDRLGKANAASLRRLAKLEELQAQEQAMRQAEAKALQDANRAAGTGGYQSSFAQDSDFMEGDPSAGGQATTATMGSFKQGGIVGLL